MSEKVVVHTGDWPATLHQLTNLECPVKLDNLPDDLLVHKRTLFEAWNETVLFVALCKVKLKSKTNASRVFGPNNHHFVTVALVGPPLTQLSHLDVETISKVVCFVGGPNTTTGCHQVCLLNADFRRHVLSRLIVSSHKDKLSNADLARLPSVSKKMTAEAKKEKLASKKKYITRAEKKGPKCRCEICSHTAYNDNMSKVGPERLVTYEPDVTELLNLLGLASPANLDAIKTMCEMSVASMDIESTTTNLDMYDPAELQTGLEHGSIDGVGLDGYLKKIQKPLMIAHLDALMTDADPVVFVVESDAEESIYKMLKDYWKFVRTRQKICKAAKASLAEPILSVISKYSKAHVEFHLNYPWHDDADTDEGDPEKDVIGASWRASIPGKLQRALSKLVSNYAVFSFYG
jgi:hypothetical protein